MFNSGDTDGANVDNKPIILRENALLTSKIIFSVIDFMTVTTSSRKEKGRGISFAVMSVIWRKVG